MKVAMVCPYDWSFPGGVRTHILGLASALRRKGMTTEIIAPATMPEPGITVVGGSVGIPVNGSVARIGFSRSAKSRIAELLDGGDFDLLHVHEPGAPSTSLLAVMRAGDLPIVATFHRSSRGSLGYAIARPALGRYLRRIDERIAVSEAARTLVASYFPGEYRVVPNGIEAERYWNARPDPRLEELKPLVLFVGRAERRKGFEVVLGAVEELRKQLDVRLVMTGERSGSLPDWVVPLGFVSDEALPNVFAAADVFCAPSLRGESFGLVLAEAMAAGAPVVASDLPGYREAAGGAAALVPPGDERALAGALAEVLTDQDRARELAGLGRERSQALDWGGLVPEIIGAYQSAEGHRMMMRRSGRS